MDTLVTLYGVPRVTPLFSCEKETHNVAVFGKKESGREGRKAACVKGILFLPADLVQRAAAVSKVKTLRST